MFSKYAVTLAALLVFGGASVAVAIEDPESRIGDRFPFLEKADRTAAKPTAQQAMVQRNAKLGLYASEDVENKIADRYPFLEQATAPSATASIQRARIQRNAKLDLYTNEDVENKIADRYPLLEQTTAVASAGTTARSMTRTTAAQKVSVRRQARSAY